MEPIRRWLQQNVPGIEVRISSPPHKPPREALAGVGLTPDQIGKLHSAGVSWIPRGEVPSWNPHVTVLADADFADIHWQGKLVNVNHGLISKGAFYTNSLIVQRENSLDKICVPGSHHAEVLRQVLRTDVVATGLVKFDAIASGELTSESTREHFSIPESAEVVTLAPTFNLELSSVPVIAERVRELVSDRPSRHLLIKLHGMAPSVWQEMYKLLAVVEPNIHYVDQDDLTHCLVAADVVISDVSSAFMEAIALNRPVVLVDNPLQTRFSHYDPSDIEYAWRDVGLRVSNADEMFAAVERCFANPDEKLELRAKYGPRLVGPMDGKASQRAASEILKTADMNIPLATATSV
jgi:hypothetical protein